MLGMSPNNVMWAVIGGLFVMFALPFLTGLVAGRKGA